MKNLLKIFLALLIFSLPLFASVKDTLFNQEYHVAFPIGDKSMNDVRTIVVDNAGQVWAGTKAGLFVLNQVTKEWTEMLGPKNQGPINSLYADEKGNVWAAAWNGLYLVTEKSVRKIEITENPVSVVNKIDNKIYALGPEAIWIQDGNSWIRENMPYSKALRGIIKDNFGGYYVATGKGLFHKSIGKTVLFQTEEELLSDDIYGLDYSDTGELWIGGLGGVTVYVEDKRVKSYTPKEGLPNVWVRCVKKGPDGTMWVGTDLGVVRYDGRSWSLRHSRRWLLDDRVRDIDFDNNRTAWIATANGVSAIKTRKMKLSDKDNYYRRIMEKRHVRPPYLVEKCQFNSPGDTTDWMPRDDDNDGQYTSMYLVMESYRYAVTKNPQAKENAGKAFNALKYLQEVTETDGFVARTVVPSSWERMADANRIISDREWADKLVDEPRVNRIENMWNLSSDGNWYWKRGTSSDEITGHMYGYLFYYELVAEGEEKERVKEHILKVIDYIIQGGYVFIDIDGEHTEWGVWAPEYLNEDPDWASERGINSVEILSYLKLAYHVSGDEKYQQEYYKLLDEHNYRENIVNAKSTLPSWRTYIDDELLILSYPALLMFEEDEELIKLYNKSFYNWYEALKDDDSPYFYFMYNAFAGNELKLDRSLFLLQDNPLDLVQWRVDNSKREDLHLTRYPIMEDVQTNRLVPPSERGIMRWDKNPWAAVKGEGGILESDGVYWRLAYWAGRYYGLIE